MIIRFLLSKEDPAIFTKGNVLHIEKERLTGLMDNNRFAESQTKLELWRGLKWIHTEGRYFTKRAYLKETKSYKRMVYIDLSVYEILKDMVSTSPVNNE